MYKSKRKKKSRSGIAGYTKAVFGNKKVKSLKKRMSGLEKLYQRAVKKAKSAYSKKHK